LEFVTIALLVIDVQQGLCTGQNPAHDATTIIARINRVAAQARRANMPVIFIQHESASGMLTYGTADWQLAQGLEATPEDLRVRKTTPDAFLKTDLEAMLKRRGVTELAICGMHTEFCVDTTTRRALALGYPVILVGDAHTTAGNAVLTPRQIIDHHNETLTQIASFGPRVRAVSSADITFDD
jgi:nicotinamidase-related amidase